MKPDENKTVGKSLHPQAIAAIGVLASFTHGQSCLAQEFLKESVALRTDADLRPETDADPVVRKQDVKVAIQMVYERAGVLPANITKIKTETAKGKERMRAEKKTSSKGKKKADDQEQAGEAA